jgi:sister chromatid cohesion protein DCC1
MLQFLGADEIAGGDIKKRDATVLKFVRKVKEKDGSTTWTARNLW